MGTGTEQAIFRGLYEQASEEGAYERYILRTSEACSPRLANTSGVVHVDDNMKRDGLSQ